MDGLLVELGGHARRLANVSAVHQPKAGRHGGGEGNAVVDEGERRRAGHVLPLRARRPACGRGAGQRATRGARRGPRFWAGPPRMHHAQRQAAKSAQDTMSGGGHNSQSGWRARTRRRRQSPKIQF